MSFICHIHNYTEYNEEWNVFSAFNPSKWSSGQPTLRRPGSSCGFGALPKDLTSVVDTSCQSRDSNPQPWVTSPTLYPLGHDCPDRVHHLRTGNDRNQKDTDRTASWKRCDRPWFALLEFVLLVKVPRGNRCREGLRWLHGEWLMYAKSTSQFHWRFLLKSEMIGASK